MALRVVTAAPPPFAWSRTGSGGNGHGQSVRGQSGDGKRGTRCALVLCSSVSGRSGRISNSARSRSRQLMLWLEAAGCWQQVPRACLGTDGVSILCIPGCWVGYGCRMDRYLARCAFCLIPCLPSIPSPSWSSVCFLWSLSCVSSSRFANPTPPGGASSTPPLH